MPTPRPRRSAKATRWTRRSPDAHAAQAAAEAQANAGRQPGRRRRGADGHPARPPWRRSRRSAAPTRQGQRRAEESAAARAERQKREAEAQAAREREAVAAHPAGRRVDRPGAGPHGQLQPPVIGVVVKGWGEETDGGPATGVSYHAPPGAHVISPCGGRVVFAKTFPQLWPAADCRLRRRLPRRAVGLRPSRCQAGPEHRSG